MNVGAVLERRAQGRHVGNLGQQPQLDLRIVGGDELVSRRRDEGAADLAAFLGADRNVLQVRLGRRQPSGAGRRQRVAGVDAVGLGVEIGRQRVGIGRAQLRHLPPFEDLRRQLVALLGQVFQRLGAGRPLSGLGLGAARQLHLAEQHVAQLLRAAGIERRAGERVDFLLDRRLRLGEFVGELRQQRLVDGDAALLHPRQHARQRAFQRLIDGGDGFVG